MIWCNPLFDIYNAAQCPLPIFEYAASSHQPDHYCPQIVPLLFSTLPKYYLQLYQFRHQFSFFNVELLQLSSQDMIGQVETAILIVVVNLLFLLLFNVRIHTMPVSHRQLALVHSVTHQFIYYHNPQQKKNILCILSHQWPGYPLILNPLYLYNNKNVLLLLELLRTLDPRPIQLRKRTTSKSQSPPLNLIQPPTHQLPQTVLLNPKQTQESSRTPQI